MRTEYGDDRLPQRFWNKVYPEPNTGCWLWGGALTHGHSHWVWKGKHDYGHRIIYSELVGVIPDGKVIDHLCRTPSCVNPQHLEVTTNKENILRGVGFSAKNARKTHCTRGHEYTAATIRVRKDGSRDCLICHNIRQKGYYANSSNVPRSL